MKREMLAFPNAGLKKVRHDSWGAPTGDASILERRVGASSRESGVINSAQTFTSVVSFRAMTEARLAAFASQLSKLERQLEAQQRPTWALAEIDETGETDVRLKKRISISVEVSADEAIAHHGDSGVSASGDNFDEAVRNLKSLLVETYLVLRDYDERALSAALLRQRGDLSRILEMVENG